MSEPRRGPRDEERGPAPAIRASDAEREQVAEIVRRAVGDGRLTLVEGDERLAGIYATVHRGELLPFTADLGETAPEPAPAPWYRAEAPSSPRPATTTSVAVMGGADVDLRGADLRGGVTIRALALMGGVDIVVDPDTRVEEHGVGLMGGFDDESGHPARDDGPVVRVTGLAMMGGVTVKRRRPGIDGGGRPERLEGDDGRGPRGLHGGH